MQLPHNANLLLWRKRASDSCPLCGERQTLIHVLNSCQFDLVERDSMPAMMLSLHADIVSLLSAYTPPTTSLSADLGSYTFPHHIVVTDLRTDVEDLAHRANHLLRVILPTCSRAEAVEVLVFTVKGQF